MALTDATVTITLGDLQALQDKVRIQTSAVAELRSAIANQRLDSGEDTRKFFEAFTDAMRIVRFAVGNMDPMTVRGWPHRELSRVAAALTELPGIDGDDVDTANDLKHFARKCSEWEDARDKGIEQAKLHDENSARGPISPI